MKIIDAVAIDGTNTTVYSEPIELSGIRDMAHLGYQMVETSATFATTVTLQAEIVLRGGDRAPSPPAAGTTTYDTGWVDLTADHGWSGFPAGDTTSGDQSDAISVYDIGHPRLRLKVVRTGGAGTVTISANTKARS